MPPVARSFQVFAKPAGPACNLACDYCYYVGEERDDPAGPTVRMPDLLLEEYIVQHIEASPDETVRFSWHGGEPTVLGLDYFRRIVALERRHRPAGRRIANGIQTNGTLLDDEWGRFLTEEGFAVGLSLDGPEDVHDRHRIGKGGQASFRRALRGHDILRRHGVPTDILCVVTAGSAGDPLRIYGFLKDIGTSHVSFLPLVDEPAARGTAAGPHSVSGEAWGDFLCTVFDAWVREDIGRIKIQIVEEAARTAFGQEHSLCLFRPVCGDIPVVERNGDVFPCDHFAGPARRIGNILETPLAAILESPAQTAFGRAKRDTLPRACRECEVLEMCNGECPKNRFLAGADGEPGLNYLCSGYRRFFNHVRPFVADVAAAWKNRP